MSEVDKAGVASAAQGTQPKTLPESLPAGVRLLVPLTLTGSHYSYPCNSHQFSALVWPSCIDWASVEDPSREYESDGKSLLQAAFAAYREAHPSWDKSADDGNEEYKQDRSAFIRGYLARKT